MIHWLAQALSLMTKKREWQTQRQQETKGRVREQDRDGNGEKLAFMRLWVGLPNMIINRLVLIFLCQSCPWLVAGGRKPCSKPGKPLQAN